MNQVSKRVLRLREALQPFAEFATVFPGPCGDPEFQIPPTDLFSQVSNALDEGTICELEKALTLIAIFHLDGIDPHDAGETMRTKELEKPIQIACALYKERWQNPNLTDNPEESELPFEQEHRKDDAGYIYRRNLWLEQLDAFREKYGISRLVAVRLLNNLKAEDGLEKLMWTSGEPISFCFEVESACVNPPK